MSITIIISLIGSLILISLVIFLFFYCGWRYTHSEGAISPYGTKSFASAELIAYPSLVKLEMYLQELSPNTYFYFDIKTASICRDTLRIFPNLRNSFGVAKLKTHFLNQYFPGNYTPWHALKANQQEQIKRIHHNTLEEYQTTHISKDPWNLEITEAQIKPGPLYVDLKNYDLLGWKLVPGTSLEVLIHQKASKQ